MDLEGDGFGAEVCGGGVHYTMMLMNLDSLDKTLGV